MCKGVLVLVWGKRDKSVFGQVSKWPQVVEARKFNMYCSIVVYCASPKTTILVVFPQDYKHSKQ